ncbi:AraC family transcriptional regulator [Spirosoma sp. RP8]|uniref:AraC family transcriptional regulator n=1 Tax=Spirosoma liriopis TaxID=2937440 RepID=A0ABT0HR16_9BACT|nr:AraC family transcriptional regulator [Spirosoma liriopis]MCK8494623.1 AraC family transcriptional regulator [Spirosoma liriopis]
MSQSSSIQEFTLDPQNRASLFVKKLQGSFSQEGHDIGTPHRDDHYLFMLASEGEMVLNIDFARVEVKAPALVLITPGQVHNVLAAKRMQGWTAGFDASLIDGDFLQVLTRYFRRSVVSHPQQPLLDRSHTLLQLLEVIQTGSHDAYTHITLRSLLTALLSLLAGQLTNQSTGVKEPERRVTVIEQTFHQLLEQHYANWKQPAQYAAELAVSVSYLNEVVKTITGHSPSSLIQQRSILEAKRLLYFTNLTVKEIGYQLGYEDPIYFNKLFRKRTGSTPLAFRQQFRD